MRLASLLLTSMPGMRVLDAHVHIGCHHLPPLKVYHQLTLAGIEGATLLADPETLGLLCGSPCALEVADRWRHPRYLTRRGNCHSRKYPYPWLLPIPAIPLLHGCVSKSRRSLACDDLSPQYDLSLLADGNERLTQGIRKRRCLDSYPRRVTGVHRRVLTRLLWIPTAMRNASRQEAGREMSGVSGLGSRRVVPTGRLAIRGAMRHACSMHVSPRTCWSPPLGGNEPTATTERGDTKAMIDLIENIAKAIVDKPDQVRVNGVEGENSIVIELRVAKEDIGKVIGKNGRTITAMRTILNATRAQKEKRHVLEVLE
jgi:predicted RNA-binding protein YlqC (UPF0109 family)